MANAVGDATRPGCRTGDGARTGAETSARARGDMDRPEVAEGKVDITTPDKTNKTPILVSY